MKSDFSSDLTHLLTIIGGGGSAHYWGRLKLRPCLFIFFLISNLLLLKVGMFAKLKWSPVLNTTYKILYFPLCSFVPFNLAAL